MKLRHLLVPELQRACNNGHALLGGSLCLLFSKLCINYTHNSTAASGH